MFAEPGGESRGGCPADTAGHGHFETVVGQLRADSLPTQQGTAVVDVVPVGVDLHRPQNVADRPDRYGQSVVQSVDSNQVAEPMPAQRRQKRWPGRGETFEHHDPVKPGQVPTGRFVQVCKQLRLAGGGRFVTRVEVGADLGRGSFRSR